MNCADQVQVPSANSQTEQAIERGEIEEGEPAEQMKDTQIKDILQYQPDIQE